MAGRILILDDEEKMVSLLVRSLERSGYEAVGHTNPEQAIEAIKASSFDVLVTDLRMPGLDGLQVLERAKKIDPSLDVVLMTAFASVETVREAMKCGAADYLVKPVSAEDDLKPLLQRLLAAGDEVSGITPTGSSDAVPISHPTQPAIALPRAAAGESGIRCPSPTMQNLYRKAVKVAATTTTVLLRGESGTGKEVLADLIQANSPRKDAVYLKVNCGALPETLLESELFGHVKGSYTGATSDRKGLFQSANGGTLLLDEIGEVTPALQVKLLRVLQQGEITRVGESTVRKVDVRVIAATNRPLEKMIETGQFRQDLYYRLNVVPLEIPPLRDRPEDLDHLIGHFASRFSPGDPVTFDPDVLEAMRRYDWPGNIRELENAIEHMTVLCEGGRVSMDDLPATIQQSARDGGASALGNVAGAVGQASLEEIEKRCLLQALEKTGGNRTHAARILNITRRTLGYRLRKYGLEDEVNRRMSSREDGGLEPD